MSTFDDRYNEDREAGGASPITHVIAFNPHNNRTADGIVVTVGLVVFDNNLDVVTVTGERASGCCSIETHVGQMFQTDPRGWFSDHSAATCDAGGYCRHDHWFETTGGSFNGERLSTTFEGRKAAL